VRIRWILAGVAAGLFAAGGARAEVDADAVMRAIDARERGRDQTMMSTWTLVERSGSERRRVLRSYWRDFRGEGGAIHSKRIVVFDAPPDLADTAFLVSSPLAADRDDDRWIYLPALRKVRRIAGRDRGQSFFGTDFAYEDLAERSADEDTHRFLRTERTAQGERQLIESVPKDATFPYAKRDLWVDPTNHTVTRIEFFDRKGRAAKTLTVAWQRVDGIWAWRRLEMRSALKGHRTVVEVTSVRHNTRLPDALFNEASLRLGVRRSR
jgi:outer membrane lipoprotein-sorting protein